jgi:dTDP-4-amino-4,6-dideoxygalactose transaminase
MNNIGGSFWLMAIITKGRDAVIEYLRSHGVECDLVQLRNDIFKIFGGTKQDLPNMNRLESDYFYLPLNCKVTTDDVKYIAKLLCDR